MKKNTSLLILIFVILLSGCSQNTLEADNSSIYMPTPIQEIKPIQTEVVQEIQPTQIETGCTNIAELISESPNGENIVYDEEHIKTWVFKNVGTCTWKDKWHGYKFVTNNISPYSDALKYDNGSRYFRGGEIAPNETITMTRRIYISYKYGEYFDEGDFAESWYWVDDNGKRFSDNFIFTYSISDIPPLPQIQNGCTNLFEFYDDITIPDGTTFKNGEVFVKTWRLRNVGTCIWEEGYFVVQTAWANWDSCSVIDIKPIGETVYPNWVVDVSVTIRADYGINFSNDTNGEYNKCYFRLRNPEVREFYVAPIFERLGFPNNVGYKHFSDHLAPLYYNEDFYVEFFVENK